MHCYAVCGNKLAMQVARQVLPTLEALCGDARGEGSTEMAVDALCEVWRAFAPNAKALQHIHGQLDTLLSSDDHEVGRILRAKAMLACLPPWHS